MIYTRDISVSPMVVFTDSLHINIDNNNLKLTIGTDKLAWNSAPADGDLRRPLEIPAKFDHNSVYGLYLQGKNNISFRNYITAEEKLSACLQKDPFYVPALADMASLQIRKHQYQMAAGTAATVLSVDTYNPAANYYYGLAHMHLGNITDAKDGFDIAVLGVAYRSAAYTELSKLYYREKDETNAMVPKKMPAILVRYAVRVYAEVALCTSMVGLMGLLREMPPVSLICVQSKMVIQLL